MEEKELKLALDALKSDRVKYDLFFALADSRNTIEALKSIGRSTSWYHSIPEDERNHILFLATELHANARMRAKEIFDAAIVEAAEVKINGLRSRNEKIKQDSATEILDRTLGKPNQPITGKDGGAIVISWDDDD